MQAISNPPYCFYIFIRCNGFYFLPDIAYMHIQCLCFTHIWLIPRIFKYILLAKHLLRVFKQQFQYCKFLFIYSILYKPCIFKAYRLLNVQTLCIFPCFCPYEPKQGKFLFSADYLIQQSCGSTLRFPCSVSVNVHCGTDISVSEKFLHIFRCCTV